METELAIERYNSRQGVENIFQQSTDLVNQRDIYNQMHAITAAGKRALMNNMLMSGLSLAGSLYSPKSVGKQAASSYGKGSDGYGWGNSGNISLGGYDSSKWKTTYGTSYRL